MREDIQLQVLICTLGEAGIRRIVAGSHPAVAGVEYLVSWQMPADTPIPAPLLRPDFRIVRTNTIGIAKNRNIALALASAPIAIMTDDDTSFSEDQLKMVISEHNSNPQYDVITFKYHSNLHPKKYPDIKFNLRNPAKGYFVTCFEITFKPSRTKGKVSFNDNFGFHTVFLGGEEDIFICDCLRAGLICEFIPKTLCTHPNSTTGERDKHNPKLIECKGAVFCHTHPRSWLLRMLAHALRYAKAYGFSRFLPYCRYWLQGAIKYHRLPNA